MIATSREPDKIPDVVNEIQSLGGHWGKLDVISPDLEGQFQELYKIYGRLDVLINNAGTGLGSTVEQTDMQAARLVFETNFFGTMRLTQLAIPLMRTQREGTIVNISSGTTLNPGPMVAVYSASKCAVEAFTEALKKEVAAFNIRVLLVHPGGIRTPFIGRSPVTEIKEEYRGTPVEFVVQLFQTVIGKEVIDPEKAAARIVEAVDETGMLKKLAGEDYLRIPMGQDIADRLREKGKGFLKSAEMFDGICQSVEFTE